jgi:hypothetical protein
MFTIGKEREKRREEKGEEEGEGREDVGRKGKKGVKHRGKETK